MDTEGKERVGWIERVTLKHIYSDQISHSVMSDSLRPHESQHARPPCPSSTPGVHSDSCACGMWGFSFLTGDQTLIPCIERWILNLWTTKEIPVDIFSNNTHSFFNKQVRQQELRTFAPFHSSHMEASELFAPGLTFPAPSTCWTLSLEVCGISFCSKESGIYPLHCS